MQHVRDWTAEEMADTFLLWWQDAGVHSAASDAPVDWRELSRPPVRSAPPTRSARAEAVPTPLAPHREASQPAVAASTQMPRDLGAFMAWLARDEVQPEAQWSGALHEWSAQDHLPLLIVVEAPDAEAPEHDPLAPEARQLVDAMLRAIGIDPANVPTIAMARRRPLAGLIDSATSSALVVRLRQYLSLARPGALLILGDKTNRALIEAHGHRDSGKLSSFSCDSGNIPVAAIAGTDLLLRRPAAKASSWRTLRLLWGTLNA